jgi:hypothetical protein
MLRLGDRGLNKSHKYRQPFTSILSTMPRKPILITASRSSGRKGKPSQKALENSRLDAELQVAPTAEPQPATPSEESQVVKDEPQPVDESLLEGHCKPIKTTSKGSLKRRSLVEVMADIPPIKSVVFGAS